MEVGSQCTYTKWIEAYQAMIDSAVLRMYNPLDFLLCDRDTRAVMDSKLLSFRLTRDCTAEAELFVARESVCKLSCTLLPSYLWNKYNIHILSTTHDTYIFEVLAMMQVCGFFGGGSLDFSYITVNPTVQGSLKYERSRFFGSAREKRDIDDFLERIGRRVVGTPFCFHS